MLGITVGLGDNGRLWRTTQFVPVTLEKKHDYNWGRKSLFEL